MFKRIVAVLLVLSIAFVAGVVIISARASAVVVPQEPPVAVSEFSIGDSSPPLTPSQFGPPQFNSTGIANVATIPRQTPSGFIRPAATTVEMTQLLRASYLLPADAAESLTKLFAHKATTLVECQIKEGDDRANGLVKFVVTAEPATQQSIKEFIAAIFPEANVKKYLSENDSKNGAVNSGGDLSENLKLVSVKLPGMTCGGCAASVGTALAKVKGISGIQLSVKENTASFKAVKALDVKALLNELVEDGVPHISGWSLNN